MDKNQLRKELKSLRNRLSKEEVAAKAAVSAVKFWVWRHTAMPELYLPILPLAMK